MEKVMFVTNLIMTTYRHQRVCRALFSYNDIAITMEVDGEITTFPNIISLKRELYKRLF